MTYLKFIAYALLFAIGLPVVLVIIFIVKVIFTKHEPEYDYEAGYDWNSDKVLDDSVSDWRVLESGELENYY